MAMMISYHVGKNYAAVVETDLDGVTYELFPGCSKAEKQEFFDMYHRVSPGSRHVTGLVFSFFVGQSEFSDGGGKE